VLLLSLIDLLAKVYKTGNSSLRSK